MEYHYQLLTHLNRSWPAVSQICNLIFWPETSTILVPNSTPIVWGQSAITAWEGRRGRRDRWRGRWREGGGEDGGREWKRTERTGGRVEEWREKGMEQKWLLITRNDVSQDDVNSQIVRNIYIHVTKTKWQLLKIIFVKICEQIFTNANSYYTRGRNKVYWMSGHMS